MPNATSLIMVSMIKVQLYFDFHNLPPTSCSQRHSYVFIHQGGSPDANILQPDSWLVVPRGLGTKYKMPKG